MKKFIVVLIAFLTLNNIYGQNTTSRLTIIKGGSVNFHFNSYTKLDNGIETGYNNWTNLQVYFIDTTNAGAINAGANWELYIKARTAQIDGDGGNSMPLDKVEYQVTTSSGTAISGWQQLTNSDLRIVSGGANPSNTENVYISYRVGASGTNDLLNEDAGYYYVDLIFTLDVSPGGVIP